ncbi:MAG: hypothetical protein RI973_345 [Bacteroidota bacterium]|jgi:hypothetical protein
MANKKILYRVLMAALISIALLLVALALIPFIFKDKIMLAVKQAINENLDAKVDFSDVDISLLRTFPNVGVGLEDYAVTGVGVFDGVPLASGEYAGVSVNFWSAWNFGKAPLDILSMELRKPVLNILVLKNGKANYDIVKPSADTSTTATQYQIKLREYAIEDGMVTYNDRLEDMYLELKGLNHQGEGDFTQDIFDLRTTTDIESLTLESGGIPYLKKAHLNYEAGFNLNLPQSKYTLLENSLTINEMNLKAEGWASMPDSQSVDMDLALSSAGDFKSLLSLIPNAYIAGYESVKANGKFDFSASFKGAYRSATEYYPAYNMKLVISDANVQYPDLPLGISNINSDIAVQSPGGNLDRTTVNVSAFKLQIGTNPIAGYFRLKTPLSDPDVDCKITGKLDLEELSRAFPMEGIEKMAGIIALDVLAQTRMSTIDRGDYGNVRMQGVASVKNLEYDDAEMPAIGIQSMQMEFTPKFVSISDFNARLGKSDLRGNGRIDNILAYFSPNATMTGNLNLQSDYFLGDEWTTSDTATAAAPPAASAEQTASEEAFKGFDFNANLNVKKLSYDVYELSDFIAKGNLTPDVISFSELSGKIGESDFNFSGNIGNVWDYLYYNEKLTGSLQLKSKFFDLNPFMTTEEPSEDTGPVLVPDYLDVSIEANMDRVHYDNLDLNDVKGSLAVADETVRFTDLEAGLLGGKISMDGAYDTKDANQPGIDFNMRIDQMDFQKAFQAFNTFQVIAPIGKYVKGIFNTEFSLNSKLKSDLMPVLPSITSKGLLQTLNASISGFTPLEKVGELLQIQDLKNIVIKDSKNWFKVEDGAVTLDDFNLTHQGIDLVIGGSHQLAGGMDYKIIARIPREKIGNSSIGQAANTGLDRLSKEAAKAGFNINNGKYVNVQINLGGSMSDPKIGLKFLGLDGPAEDFKQAVAGQVKAEVEKQLEDAKAQAEARLQAEKEKALEQAKKEAEKVKAEAEKKLSEQAKKAGEEVKKKAGEEAKKKLEEINPFKKKKEGGGN